MEQNKYDVIIVGAGPIGISCGIEAKKSGLNHLIIEKGCIVNSIFNYPKNMTFFSTSDRLEIGNVPFISHGDKPTRREALEYFRRVVQTWQLNVNIYEKVLNIDKKDNTFQVMSNKRNYVSKNVIIATGFYGNVNLLHIPGEELSKVKHYYDEPHPYAFQKVAVIGAGNSAVDAALETFRRGADVTMIIREPVIRSTVKYWVKPDIENRINEGSIKAYFNSKVKEIREQEIVIHTPDEIVTLENDFVLAMTGYHPDYEFLRAIGIDISNDQTCIPCHDSDVYETNIKGIFLAGVVCGGMDTSRWSIENSKYHAEKIFRYISQNE